MCAPRWPTATNLTRRARVCGTRQHPIFGRYPTFGALTAQMWRQFVFDRSGAYDTRVAHLDQRRTFGVCEKARCDANLSQIVGGAGISAFERHNFYQFPLSLGEG